SSTMPVNNRASSGQAPGDATAGRFLPCPFTRRCNAAGHGRRRPAARVLPPIRTLTVGPGVSPGQPAAVAAGDRTVTAGWGFHRPRSTLASVTSVPYEIFRALLPAGGRPPPSAGQ